MASKTEKGGMAMLLALKPKGGEPDADEMGGPSDMDADNAAESNFDISMPDGFKVPDGKEPGMMFDSVVKIHVTDDGKLCIDEIEGVPTSPRKEETVAVPEDEDDTAGMVQDTEPANQGATEADPKLALGAALRRKKEQG